ncbi:Radical SAM domain protein [Denitrovibrio acetiphilus DSM 12809]|uniref:Radical SAM domain protein n=1 Tax=Denitrovibrio acetiphilus (strain DSM 12809 / NBRC 114555 / N2460) TaxID=522772 RepID=D4H1Q6_DENA2|nr:radical SAM protein [Denitrovibrio acetiphilus]ADD68816.1 Radical SAM domain protein [Denitrovibrio acetiphilus DSM 12809]
MLERYAELNTAEFGRMYDLIPFLEGSTAESYEHQRQMLLEKLAGLVQWGHRGTKADVSAMSEGCRLCGEGVWSCLFINGKCNCDCFYCPASQNEECLPTTNAVSFSSPAEYTAYLKEFGFRGASISGGEPLLTPERTLSYIKAVKDEFKDKIYMWMYTNGSLVTKDILQMLKEAGLDEIRFDIGATDYDLSKLKSAVGIIPFVTVEIPAVPEELDNMKTVMHELAKIGVNHLNLHQLRLTPYNFPNLIERDYHYIHNESVTVAESELTALELMLYGKQNSINLPVNYCSFPYKNRYQGYASRKRSIEQMIKNFETITKNGYIRRITVAAPDIQGSLTAPSEKNGDSSISIHQDDISEISHNADIIISYFSARQIHSVSYRNPFKIIHLTDSKDVVIERFRVSKDIRTNASDFANGILPDECRRFEVFSEGLLDYI